MHYAIIVLDKIYCSYGYEPWLPLKILNKLSPSIFEMSFTYSLKISMETTFECTFCWKKHVLNSVLGV